MVRKTLTHRKITRQSGKKDIGAYLAANLSRDWVPSCVAVAGLVYRFISAED